MTSPAPLFPWPQQRQPGTPPQEPGELPSTQASLTAPKQLVADLGPFTVDPSATTHQPWRTAKIELTADQHPLTADWPDGLAWCHPPHDGRREVWLERCATHRGGAIVLVPAATDTEAFHQWLWPYASAILFIQGRLHLHHSNGSRATGSCGYSPVLVGYGDTAARRLADCTVVKGHLVNL